MKVQEQYCIKNPLKVFEVRSKSIRSQIVIQDGINECTRMPDKIVHYFDCNCKYKVKRSHAGGFFGINCYQSTVMKTDAIAEFT